jgi:hypothetical protein
MPEESDFLEVVKSLRVQIKQIVKTDKLMAHIVKRSLDPILAVIEDIHLEILNEIGQFVVEILKEEVSGERPSGKTYIIVEFDPNVEPYTPGGGRYKVVGEHTASAPSSYPAEMTGALMESIGFQITKAGVLKLGQVNLKTGGWSVDRRELKTVFFKGNKIFVNDEIGKATSVGRYSQWLEEGTENMAARPWISQHLKEIQPAIKDFIKERLHRAIKRRTRSEGVRKAFTFNIFIARR